MVLRHCTWAASRRSLERGDLVVLLESLGRAEAFTSRRTPKNLRLVASRFCNQIRSPGVRFGKRAVVGAVRVFGPTPDYVFIVL